MTQISKWSLVSLVLGALVLLGGCTDQLKKEKAALELENQQLRGELDGMKGKLTEKRSQTAALQSEMDKKDARIAQLQAAKKAAAKKAAAPPKKAAPSNHFGPGYDVAVGQRGVVVNLSSKILFASGKAMLKKEAKSQLAHIANVIQTRYPGRKISVEGHTDSDPIRKSKWKDNLELSMARASAVAQDLIRRGIAPNRIQTMGFGATRPKASNATSAGKARNRRVEIVILK